jgi:hypothetical protein
MVEEVDAVVSKGETLRGCKGENSIKTQLYIYW